MTRRHVLIGSGPASVAAAEAIRGADPSADIKIVAAEREGYYSRPGLAYYLAKEEPEKALFPFSARDFARLGVETIRDRALRIDRTGRTVVLSSGAQVAYDRLLIATGSAAIPVDVPGADLDGVTKLDDISDARDLIRRSGSATSAVVVGGGITALEIVEGLREHRLNVHYFLRKDRYWSNVFSEAESRIVEDGLEARGVHIHYFTELARIIGENGRVVAVETGEGLRIPCEIVAVAIGVLPQKDLAEAAGLDCARGVLVDPYLRSSDPDIFAAGDVAEVQDPGTDRRTIEVLWNSASAKGRVAGLNMATEPTRAYRGGAPLNVTRLAGFRITIMGTVGSGKDSDLKGIARGDSEVWRRLDTPTVVEKQEGDAHLRLALGSNVVVGAVVMGGQALSFPLQEIIGQHADISAIIGDLQAPGASVGDLINAFWRDWSERRV